MSKQIEKAITNLQAAVRQDSSAAKAVFRATTTSAEDSFTTTSRVRGFALGLDILRRPVPVTGTLEHVPAGAAVTA